MSLLYEETGTKQIESLVQNGVRLEWQPERGPARTGSDFNYEEKGSELFNK